jgi:Putative DNA-binding domain
VGLRILYLTELASAFNKEAFRGMKLAGQLPGGGELLVRHWLTDSRDEAIARNPGLEADATDRVEFEAFDPDIVFLEGGLYWNGEDWRIPPDLAVSFVEAGGAFIVADVERNEMTEHYRSYVGDLRFFGASLDGLPEAAAKVRYVRDDVSNDGHPVSVMCPWPQSDWGWPKDAYQGVDRVLAVSPVALGPQGQVLLWSAPTATVLSQDYIKAQGRTAPLATVARHGLGYAAVMAAAVSSDMVTDRNPGNIHWLCNVAALMHERAVLERGLRHGGRTAPRARPRCPYADRTAAELATFPESKFLEHKQTFAFNIHTRQKDTALSDSVLNRICSFWNAEGGTLLVGVEDRTGRVVGIGDDIKLFKDLDGLVKSVSDRLHQEIGVAAPSIDVRSEEAYGESLLRIDTPAGDMPLFRRDRFFVRVNNTTQELKGESIQRYLSRRWPA